MYIDPDDVNYHEEDEIDMILDDYEVVEDEDELDCPRCSHGCNYCL